MGRWDELVADGERAIEEAGEHGGEQVVVGAKGMLAGVGFLRGQCDLEPVRAGYEMALDLSDPQSVAPNAAWRVAMATAAGRLDEANRAADVLRDVVPHGTRDRALLVAAPWLVVLGRTDDLEFLTSRESPDMWRYANAAVEFGRGIAAQARGRLDEADAHLEKATGVFEGMGHRWDATLARIHHCEVLEALGRTEDAAETREKAAVVASELGATRALGWLEQGTPLAAAG